MGVGDDPVRRNREAAAMPEPHHLAILNSENDDADDRAAGRGDVIGARGGWEGEEEDSEREKAEHGLAPGG